MSCNTTKLSDPHKPQEPGSSSEFVSLVKVMHLCIFEAVVLKSSPLHRLVQPKNFKTSPRLLVVPPPLNFIISSEAVGIAAFALEFQNIPDPRESRDLP